MTILVGFSATRHGDAPINLAAQIAETTGQPAVAAAVIERPWPPRDDPAEKDYLECRSEQVRQSLGQIARKLPGAVPAIVHESSSVPTGLLELATELKASLVVVGSSSSGLIGRVALGSVTGRLVYTAAVPVVIAPRGYPPQSGGVSRISASYGGEADINGLISTTAELADRWSVPLRIVSFTVRPSSPFGGVPNAAAEDLVVQQWARRMQQEVTRQLDGIRTLTTAPAVEVGSGPDWRDAVESVGWRNGDILALGSGAAGPAQQVFLGSAASKIIRHSPAPVLIMPRRDR
jgi:nucleotide-binding universal stress UspA family protein